MDIRCMKNKSPGLTILHFRMDEVCGYAVQTKDRVIGDSVNECKQEQWHGVMILWNVTSDLLMLEKCEKCADVWYIDVETRGVAQAHNITFVTTLKNRYIICWYGTYMTATRRTRYVHFYCKPVLNRRSWHERMSAHVSAWEASVWRETQPVVKHISTKHNAGAVHFQMIAFRYECAMV